MAKLIFIYFQKKTFDQSLRNYQRITITLQMTKRPHFAWRIGYNEFNEITMEV